MRTTNGIERPIQQELKRRTRNVRIFPNEASLLRLASAILVEIDDIVGVKLAELLRPYSLLTYQVILSRDFDGKLLFLDTGWW